MRLIIGFVFGLLAGIIAAGCANSTAASLPVSEPVAFSPSLPELPAPVPFLDHEYVDPSPVTVTPSVTPAEPAPAVPSLGAGAGFTSCANGSCGPARRLASAPVRFISQRQPLRRFAGRLFGRRR